MQKILAAFFCLITLLSALPAQAHRPYLVKQNSFNIDGTTIIVEKLFGDGIFSADPVSLQLRNSHGTVLAYSETAHGAASFCYSLKFCIATIYEPWSLIGNAVMLRSENIKPGSISPELDLGSDEITDYRDYLAGTSNQARSSAFGDPYDRGSNGLFQPSLIAAVLAPLLIISDNTLILILFMAIGALFGWTKTRRKNSSKTGILLKVLSFIVFVIIFVVGFIIVTLVVMHSATPGPYFITAMLLGSWLTKYLILRARRRAAAATAI